MSEPTVVVVESGEPPEVQVAENAADAGSAMAAGAALVTAEHAEETAGEALVVAEEAAAVAVAALEVSCCEHCVEHSARLAALEEGRGAELEAELAAEEEELAAPAPEMRPEPEPKAEKPRKQAVPAPAKRGGFWPL